MEILGSFSSNSIDFSSSDCFLFGISSPNLAFLSSSLMLACRSSISRDLVSIFFSIFAVS